MSKTQSKSAINKIDTDLNSNNLVSTGSVINNPSDALLLTLNPSNNFFLDQENKEKIIKISESFTIKQTNLQQQETILTNKDADLVRENGSIAWLTTREANTRRIAIANEQATIAGELINIRRLLLNIWPRQAEYQTLANIVNEFDLNRPLSDMKGNTYDCWPDFMSPGNNADAFNFYSETGTIIPVVNYWITIKLADGKTEDVQINWLPAIAIPNWTINLTGITFTNRAGNIYAPTQWYEFTLNPGAIKRTAGWREFISTKPLKIIRESASAVNTQALRQNEVNTYNNSWRGHVIEQSLKANQNTLINKLEREAFYRWLEKADGPKFNKLNAEQKEILYQDVRKMYRTTTGRVRRWAHIWRATDLNNINNFDNWNLSFLERITGDKHESNKPEFTKSAIDYRNYVHNNLEDQIKKYFKWRFDEVFSENNDGNTFLKTQLTNYLTEIEKQKIDNDVHQDIMGDIDDVDRMENRRKHSVDINGRNYGIWRRDVNYLRFFSWVDSKVDIKDQTVNITTNNKPEDLNNEEPIKYDMNMEISGKQQILVNVKIGKNKEIKLKAGDPAAMVKRILQCEDIQHGKVRAHVVYNVMKWFIQAAKEKNISLTYRDPWTGDMMIIKMDGNNIVLEQQDNKTNFGGTHRRNTTVLFDQKYFENSNTFDSTSGHENRRLRIGIDKLMGHFNFAMNELHYQYRQASERKRMGLRRWETRTTLPTSFFLSPIKKILNFRTTTKFDFSTTVQSNGKNVSVDFKKNKFTLNIDGLKKPISSRTLGKLLRYRKWWVRIFDGMERDICGKIYEELIKKMRENTKIARTNFGVKDCITGRTYILDSDGELWYITAEQTAADQNMVRKWRLSNREYWIVNNPPTGRIMCDESETKEVMKNPFLMGRLIKTMNNRMGIVSSTRNLLN